VEPHLFIILVIGLSMDAFVVSIGKGLALRRATVRDAMVIALWFGIGHAVMTAIGYTLSESVHQYISEFDHWIIFGVLAYIAFNLIRDALRVVLERHLAYTGSEKARSLLSDWDASCRRFLKVIPVGYKMLLKDDSN